jgi:carboxypeptidase Q
MRLLFSLTAAMHCVSAYTQAPVTNEMRSAAAAIIAALLPSGTTPGGVTVENSIAWKRLAYITDTFGPRFSGSDALESVLDWVAAEAEEDGLIVSQQSTLVPKWVRGAESATLLSPRVKKLHMVGLGMSSPGNVTAPILVVGSMAELTANCSKAVGTIVLFDVIFTTYGATVPTRAAAGTAAVACGAVGALIRTVGPYSLQNPHTGFTNAAGIPTAAVSLEDASQLRRMFERGQAPVVNLDMQSTSYLDSPSRNIIIDLPGTDLPDTYVVLSGHADTWDVAEGAMDDGGGFVTAWEALRVLSMLGLRARRTIRAVIWVNEENGSAGGITYSKSVNLSAHSWMSECDGGAFQPYGIGVSCSFNGTSNDCSAAQQQLTTIGDALLSSIGSGNVSAGGGGTDIDPSCELGVVCAGFNVLDPRLTPDSNNPCMTDAMGAWSIPSFSPTSLPYDSQYFWVHHSEADTIERMDPRQLNHVAAASAIWAYSIAQLPELLPRNAAASTPSPSSSGASNRGAVIGGGVMGAVLAVGAVVFFYRWRYSSTPQPAPSYSALSPASAEPEFAATA